MNLYFFDRGTSSNFTLRRRSVPTRKQNRVGDLGRRSVRVAERLALPISDHGVAGSNPAGGEILPEPKRRFIAQSLSCSPFHRLEMTEILLKGRKTLTHPSMTWAASSEVGIYRLCEQRRFRRACASAQSRQNLRCSLIQAVSQKEPSDRKPDPWPLRMAGHAQLKFVMTECSKT